MITKIKKIAKNIIEELKYKSINNIIINCKINMIGKCFKYNTGDSTMYTKIVSINTETNTFTVLCINIPNIINNTDNSKLLVTNKFGPYVSEDVLPYKELSINFIDGFETNKIDISHEIDNNEFSEILISVMDKLLKIGY